MSDVICHFKDKSGSVAVRADLIISIEADEHDDGEKYTCVTIDRILASGEFAEYWVQTSPMEAINEWQRALKLRNE